MLVLASIAYQWSRNNVAFTDIGSKKVLIGLIIAGTFSILFLIGQLYAWQQLNDQGMFASSNPAVAFFYVFTAMHGLHLMGGLYVWARSIIKINKKQDIRLVRTSVELCTIYWHFMLLVWMLLFGLMIAT